MLTKIDCFGGEAEVLGLPRQIRYENRTLSFLDMSIDEAVDLLKKLKTGKMVSVEPGKLNSLTEAQAKAAAEPEKGVEKKKMEAQAKPAAPVGSEKKAEAKPAAVEPAKKAEAKPAEEQAPVVIGGLAGIEADLKKMTTVREIVQVLLNHGHDIDDVGIMVETCEALRGRVALIGRIKPEVLRQRLETGIEIIKSKPAE